MISLLTVLSDIFELLLLPSYLSANHRLSTKSQMHLELAACTSKVAVNNLAYAVGPRDNNSKTVKLAIIIILTTITIDW